MNMKNFQLCNDMDANELETRDLTGYGAQIKYDGARLKITKKSDVLTFKFRGETTTAATFPELITLKDIKGDWVLDGEVIIPTELSISDFDLLIGRLKTKDKFKMKLLSAKYPATFVAFDILEKDGVDLTGLPLNQRLLKLNELNVVANFKIAEMTIEHIKDLYARAVTRKWEGIIIKKLDSKYTGDRNDDWIKVKRKEKLEILFIKYEQNPKGLSLESKEGVRVQCSGTQHKEVKEQIDTFGYAKCEIERLGGKTFNGKHRQAVFLRLVK